MIRYAELLPAGETFRENEPLNVLLLAVNTEPENVLHTLRLYGKAEDSWRLLCEKPAAFAPNAHLHAYLQIPGSVFTPQFWGGELPEELLLSCGDAPPAAGSDGKNDKILFFRN